MENFEGFDILGKGSLLVDDSFQLFILFLEGCHSLLVFSHQLLGLHLHPFREPRNLFIFHYDLLVQIGSKFIFSLMELFGHFVDLVSEEEELELIIVDYSGFRLLQFEYSLVEAFDFFLQFLVDLHHGLYLHLGLQLHALDCHFQLRFSFLALSDPLLEGFALTLKL